MVAVAELAGVSVRRGTALLLHDVNFKVEEGDRWVIIGPNGAGKTTLLALLSTQMHPTTGVVEVLGEYLGAVDVFDVLAILRIADVIDHLFDVGPGHRPRRCELAGQRPHLQRHR